MVALSLSWASRALLPGCHKFNHGDGDRHGRGFAGVLAYLPRRSAFSAVSISSRMRARRLAGMGAVGPKLM